MTAIVLRNTKKDPVWYPDNPVSYNLHQSVVPVPAIAKTQYSWHPHLAVFQSSRPFHVNIRDITRFILGFCQVVMTVDISDGKTLQPW